MKNNAGSKAPGIAAFILRLGFLIFGQSDVMGLFLSGNFATQTRRFHIRVFHRDGHAKSGWESHWHFLSLRHLGELKEGLQKLDEIIERQAVPAADSGETAEGPEGGE